MKRRKPYRKLNSFIKKYIRRKVKDKKIKIDQIETSEWKNVIANSW